MICRDLAIDARLSGGKEGRRHTSKSTSADGTCYRVDGTEWEVKEREAGSFAGNPGQARVRTTDGSRRDGKELLCDYKALFKAGRF
jgi:hypothetical protein